jgi:Protein of unknown function (DUF1822)
MIDQPNYLNSFLDCLALDEKSIELSPDQIDRAAQLSQSVPNTIQKWQVYLHALALSGFKQWLKEWVPDLAINDDNCSLYQPPYANLIDAVCRLQVGSFQLCILAVGDAADSMVNLPRVAVDLPFFVPHIYVLTQVKEEDMQMQIYGYLRHDQLLEQQQLTPLQNTSQWTYTVPIEWFTSDSDKLLLDLQCLNPSAIPLPTVSSQVLASTDQIQVKLTDLFPQLQSPTCILKRVLTWQEGATILTHRELADWLCQAQQSSTSSPQTAISESSLLAVLQNSLLNIMQTTSQQAINVSLWLQDQLDAVAQELSWVLMPVLTPTAASALRSGVDELDRIFSTLNLGNVDIPPSARGAYRELRWGQTNLRLYALTWALPPLNKVPEWTLLLVLGAHAGTTNVPIGTRLRVRDSMQVLVDQPFTDAVSDTYLYAQVVGTLNEQFWVSIDMANGAVVTIPFTFQSEIP